MRAPLVLALSASVAALAAAAPMFLDTSPGPADPSAHAAGAGNVLSVGASGGDSPRWIGGGGGGGRSGAGVGTFSLPGGAPLPSALGGATSASGGGSSGTGPAITALVFTTDGVGGVGVGGQGGAGGDGTGSSGGGGPLGANLGSVGSALQEAAFTPVVVGGTSPSSAGSLGLGGGGGLGGNGGNSPLLDGGGGTSFDTGGGGTSFDTGNNPLNISGFQPGDGGALTPPKPDGVPEPAAIALFGAGLLGLGLVRRSRRSG